MNTFTKIALIVVAVAPIPCQMAIAVLTLSTIMSPKDCPDGLTIRTKANKGMIDIDVSVDAEKLANAGELYKGRVNARADLDIATSGGQKVASVRLQGATKDKLTSYHFTIAPSVIKSSRLYLNTNLFEKDGTPTMGGGVTMDVQLEAFEPKDSRK
jgi:hypothetical protein